MVRLLDLLVPRLLPGNPQDGGSRLAFLPRHQT